MGEGLDFVYIGNVAGHEAENTYCPKDKSIVIRRKGYRVVENNIINGKCKFCSTPISGVWEKHSNKDKQSKVSPKKPSKYLG